MATLSRLLITAVLTLAAAPAPAAEECGRGAMPTSAALTALGAPAGLDTEIEEAREALRAGRPGAARKVLEIHLAKPGAPGDRALAYSLLALARSGAGEFAAARTAAQQALSTADAPDAFAARAAFNAGIALADIGDGAEAAAALRSAAQRARAAADRPVEARSLAQLAILRARADAGDAQAAANAARTAALQLSDSALRSALLVAVGDALLDAPASAARDTAAFAVLSAAYDSASSASRGAEAAQALGLIGTLQASGGARAESNRTFTRAVALSLASGDDPWAFRWQWMLGRGQRASGDLTAAKASFAGAVDKLEDAKARFALGGGAQARLAWRGVYADFADMRLKDASAAANAQDRERALVEARATVELSRTAEVEDFFSDPCIASRSTRRVAPEDSDASVAVLYPVTLDDRLEIIVGHRSGLAQFTVPVPARELAASVQQLRAYLEKRTTRQYLRPAQALYNALIAPVAAHLEKLGVTTIVIVPDGPLRTVPFAAMHDGKRFLIERYSIAVAPVASLIDPRKIPQGDIRALVSGLTEARQGFAALPAVQEEMDALGPMLNAPVYRNAQFSSAALEDALSKAPINVLHIASHGQFSRDPSDTFVLTFDGHLTLAELRRAISAGKLREEPLELLALSACQTAAGDERAALGLAGVAIGAGARSALASLWAVNDESTSALITAFYQHLVKDGMTKAAALRQAQLDLAADERFAHPAYWAPFLVIGNWL